MVPKDCPPATAGHIGGSSRLIQLQELHIILWSAALARTQKEYPEEGYTTPLWRTEEIELRISIDEEMNAEEVMIAQVMDDKVLRKGVPATIIRSHLSKMTGWVGKEGIICWVGTTKFGPRVGLTHIEHETEPLWFDQNEVEVNL
jgi:hypothetical protein